LVEQNAPFADNMPIITYEGINAEHETVLPVGVFDVAHGRITGPNALALIQKSNFE
jgi:hypothetical protein